MLFHKFSGILSRKLYANYLSRINFYWNIPGQVELDINYLYNRNNSAEIENNTIHRKGVGDISTVIKLKDKLDSINTKDPSYDKIASDLYAESLKIPNKTHPSVLAYKDDPKIIKTVGAKRTFDKKPLEFDEITRRLKLIRTEQLGNLSGSRSYYVLGELAELEHALIQYILGILLKHNFQLVSVPDIMHRDIIEGCGMTTRSVRNQVYALDSTVHEPDLCLSGTSEIALAGYFMNKRLQEAELPIKLVAVSRCYRAETSSVAQERGIFRVHEFTKVEMFIVSTPAQSNDTLEEIRTIQEDAFESLGLHFNVLDMPPHELGAQAYRKYDVETWLSGRQLYGEISSCSSCTDYQSRRLNIKYYANNSGGDDGAAAVSEYVHTLNGTACAIPRLLIALIEAGQNMNNGTVSVPEVLQEFMHGKRVIKKQKTIPELKLLKRKKEF